MNIGSYSAYWVPALFHLVVICAAWIWYDRRRAWSIRPAARSAVFRCVACHTVYADDTGVPRAACPRCGRHNDARSK